MKNLIDKSLFQGQKYLKKNKDYFEGWYFKNTTKKYGIAFIPGISINNKEKTAFIQIITNKKSYYISYNINDFLYHSNPFYIKIKNNYFSKDYIHLDINDENLTIFGDIKYTNSTNIKENLFSPNIMGPFSYLPFMECNHAIISMNSNISGSIKLNNECYNFKNAKGYIEKDWGISFPKKYIWLQANNFKKTNTKFMLAIADIPFKIFNFKGLICSLIIDDKEYRFTTYNHAKILRENFNNNQLLITLKKGTYTLIIKAYPKEGLPLIAPVKGHMNKEIIESINSKIIVTLKDHETIIFNDTAINCGLEIVK